MNNAATLQIPTKDAGHVVATVLRGSPVAVLLCHGRAFDRESFLPYASELAAAHLTVAALDFRGYGQSVAGTEGPTARYLDVLAVADWLARHSHAARVVALGASMGGGAVLTAAQVRPSAFSGLITWSTVAVGSFAPGTAFGDCVKLFCASADEPMQDQTAAMYAAARPPKQLVLVPGALHAQQILNGPHAGELKQHVFNFLAQFLALGPESLAGSPKA